VKNIVPLCRFVSHCEDLKDKLFFDTKKRSTISGMFFVKFTHFGNVKIYLLLSALIYQLEAVQTSFITFLTKTFYCR